RYVRILLESDEVLSQIWVEGEISGFKLHSSSGHAYFSLCDDSASVRCVMFKTYADRVRFLPEDGMFVSARCKVSLYERDGSFQLYVEDIIPKGAGAVKQQLDAIRQKLEKEGLFSPERKRPLIAYPKNIAVVTSQSGAALHDIINVASRRYPLVALTLYPVNVQGMLAAPSIIDALARINQNLNIDEVIIARGGGSQEDLWQFNSEELVRAAASLRVPFISAIGHETDWTLLDYAADSRAPTPSAAAELALPDIAVILDYISASVVGIRGRACEIIECAAEQSADMYDSTYDRVAAIVSRASDRLHAVTATLDALDPVRILARGYAIAFKDGKNLSGIGGVRKSDQLEIRLSDGELLCTVDNVRGGTE
ncbi:MAG: exodeoxyribonuclease VII large subunit, partial [Oscillospiraceae bacterium]